MSCPDILCFAKNLSSAANSIANTCLDGSESCDSYKRKLTEANMYFEIPAGVETSPGPPPSYSCNDMMRAKYKSSREYSWIINEEDNVEKIVVFNQSLSYYGLQGCCIQPSPTPGGCEPGGTRMQKENSVSFEKTRENPLKSTIFESCEWSFSVDNECCGPHFGTIKGNDCFHYLNDILSYMYDPSYAPSTFSRSATCLEKKEVNSFTSLPVYIAYKSAGYGIKNYEFLDEGTLVKLEEIYGLCQASLSKKMIKAKNDSLGWGIFNFSVADNNLNNVCTNTTIANGVLIKAGVPAKDFNKKYQFIEGRTYIYYNGNGNSPCCNSCQCFPGTIVGGVPFKITNSSPTIMYGNELYLTEHGGAMTNSDQSLLGVGLEVCAEITNVKYFYPAS